MAKWQRINYQPNKALNNRTERITACSEHRELSKNAAKEGMVLLKNANNVLPLSKGSKVALFGKGTFDYVKGGGGSGDVTVSYITNLYDGLSQLGDHVRVFEESAEFYRKHVKSEYESGREPGLTHEPEVPEAILNRAKAYTDTAIISICRFSGEGWDKKSSSEQAGVFAEPWVEKFAKQSDELFAEGDFYLSLNESEMVNKVKANFAKVIVVLNVGGVIDSTWFKKDEEIQSVFMAWQRGMEGGKALAELLCGIGNPSGKLTDTFAKSLSDYPSSEHYHDAKEYVDYSDDIFVGYRYFETIPKASDNVNYPFGYGLSYTEFKWDVEEVYSNEQTIHFKVKVCNMGDFPGREVIQVYSMPPQGKLGKSNKNLVSFAKTRLLNVGESQTMLLQVSIDDLASYDDLGKVQKSAYLVEKGAYEFFIGTSVREGIKSTFVYHLEEDMIIEQLSEKLAPVELSKRMLSNGEFEMLKTRPVTDPDESVLDKRKPEEVDGFAPLTRYRDRYKLFAKQSQSTLMDVVEGKVTLDHFIMQLSDDELIHLLGGQPNTGVANTFGFGNLPEYGVPNAMTADGPAGLRIEEKCGVTTTAWPCSTLLACSWDEKLIYDVGRAGGNEVKENNIGVWLTPAVNIHRSPLCGRNFEYYSEDPFLTGKLASAMVLGIQSTGVSSAVKHFAFNNKETYRKNSDSRVSERAAREIYLKAFEIIVKEADPWCIMSAYNLVNGERTSQNRELLEDILRGEWGFKGVVTTDWWTYGEHYKEIKAGNDIKMACGFPERVHDAMALGALTREELIVSAKRVLELIMKLD